MPDNFVHLLKTAALILGLVLCSLQPASAQTLREPRFMAQAQTGFAQMFNMDYDEAMATFSRLRSDYPHHPAPSFYMGVVLWLRELLEREDLDLDKFIAPAYFDQPTQRQMAQGDRKMFMDLIAESRKSAESILERNPDENDARYFLASADGIFAAFAITVDHNRGQALSYGKKSYKTHRQLVSKDPNYYDSYMTLGLYEYIADNLPWYVKWLAWIVGYRGSEKRGFDYLHLAADRGLFVADESRLMLMVLYVRKAQYAKALTEQERLQTKYPRSFVLAVTRAQILEKMGSSDLAALQYQTVITNADAGIPNYNKLQLETARYTFGRKFMDLGRPDLALQQFLDSVRDARTPPRENVLSHLSAGQALDLLGRRDEAIAEYRAVLALNDIEGSHRQAKGLIERPHRVSSRGK